MRDILQKYLDNITHSRIIYWTEKSILYNKYQIKNNNDYWHRDKKYLFVKLISKLRKS